jgi:hypothetical protein
MNNNADKGLSTPKSDNMAAICGPTLYEMWDPWSLRTPLASTASYEDNLAFLYGDDVPTSQETHLLATTACYGEFSGGRENNTRKEKIA